MALEGAFSAYSNIIAVKAGMENAPIIKALMAAMRSQTVSSFIKTKYKGAVVPTVGLPGNGFDTDIDYSALSGKTITVAASPVPHAKILAIAKNILSQKGIKLVVQEYTDYETPNLVVEDGTFMANYFQHVPYLNDFNRKYNTHLVSAGTIHVEPLGIYAGRSTTLNHLKKQ